MVKEYECPKLNKCKKNLKVFKKKERERKKATVGLGYEDGDHRRPPSDTKYFNAAMALKKRAHYKFLAIMHGSIHDEFPSKILGVVKYCPEG